MSEQSSEKSVALNQWLESRIKKLIKFYIYRTLSIKNYIQAI